MPAPACWTCRLRRKKCDRTRPACRGCGDLSIDCHYSSERPHWMDGGYKQKQKAKLVKAQVVQGATSRRAKGFAFQVQSLQQEYGSPAIELHEAPSEDTSSSLREPATWPLPRHRIPSSLPLYCPATFAGGRTWLLKAILEQPAIYHTVISISAYYFTLLLARDASQTLRTPCEQQVWDTLELHMNCSLKIIQAEMTAFNKLSWSKEDAVKQARLLGAIVQQLIFDTAMAQGANWNLHLIAALGLFRDIIETHCQADGIFNLEAFLQTVAPRSSIFDGLKLYIRPWSEDQNSFRFFAAFLIYADVISGVMGGTPPKLQPYHGMLIADEPVRDDPQVTALETEEFIGCQGWVLAVLGQVSSIDASQSAREDNVFHEREERDREIIAEMKMKLQIGLTDAQVDSQTDPTAVQVQQAWIHGAMLYLLIVEQQCRPLQTETKNHVQFIAKMVGSPACQVSLRSIMWPFFMAGVLAGQEDEIIFTEAVSKLGPLKAFGSAKEALSLLERAWLARDETPRHDWRLSDCFGGEDRYGLLV
ncbi:Zn2-C6 fungal-type DNA-binding domain [Fusarium oxysporum f. sp. vasinfectum]|nr:Zn2-C6 fungal-type DNA-binding domain [Fusarium oxysporum f. sp. vasinfectum]